MSTSIDAKRMGLLLIGFLALSFLNYDIPFYYDDIGQILKNPSIQYGLDWSALINDKLRAGRLFMNISFALNWLISGSETWSYHLFNNFLHAVNAFLVFRWLELVGVKDRWTIAIATALFFVHPLQIEGVSYIMGRTELLKTLSTLTLLCLYLSPRRPRVVIYALLVLSLLIKETCALTPLLFVALDLLVLRLSFRQVLRREHLLYFSHIVWMLLFRQVFNFDRTHQAVVGFDLFPIFEYLWMNCYYLVFTLWLFINPNAQSIMHEYLVTPPTALAAIGAGLLLGLALLVFTHWKKRPLLVLMILFFFASYLPNSSLLQFINPFAEYRLYQSLIPLCLLAAIGLSLLRERSQLVGQSVAALVLLLALLFHGLYLSLWKNKLSLFAHAYAQYPSSFNIAATLNEELTQRGFCFEALKNYLDVCQQQKTVGLKLQCENALAILHIRTEDPDQARLNLLRMLELHAQYPYHPPRVEGGIYLVHPNPEAFYHNVVTLAADTGDRELYEKLLAEARQKYPARFANFQVSSLPAQAKCLDAPTK